MNEYLSQRGRNGSSNDAQRAEGCPTNSTPRRLAGLIGKSVAICAMIIVGSWAAYSLSTNNKEPKMQSWQLHQPVHASDMWNKLAMGFR